MALLAFDTLTDDILAVLGAHGPDEVVISPRSTFCSAPGLEYDAALGADIDHAVAIAAATAQVLLSLGAHLRWTTRRD